MNDVKPAGSSAVFTPPPIDGANVTNQKQTETKVQENPAQVQQEQPRSKEETSTRKSEVNLGGSVRSSQLSTQLSNNVSNPTLIKAQAIVDDRKMSVEAKKAELQKLMTGANREEFSDLISKSKDFSEKGKQVFNAALGESADLMKRVAKELPAEQQYETVLNVDKYGPQAATAKGLAESKQKITRNIGEWATTTSDKIYNYGLDTNKEFKDKMTDIVKTSSVGGKPHLSENVREQIVDKLNGKNKQDFITDTVYPKIKGDDNYGVTSLHDRLLKRMSGPEKNQLVDSLQDTGNLNYFLAFREDPRELLHGLTPQNAGVVAAEYDKMAAQGSKEYKIKLNQVDGYAENNLKGKDYDEYVRVRNNYHK